MLADALPDDFGNALINAWMALRGVEKNSITMLDRVAYMGRRGMGALERVFAGHWGTTLLRRSPLFNEKFHPRRTALRREEKAVVRTGSGRVAGP